MSRQTSLLAGPHGARLAILFAAVLWGTVGIATRELYSLAPTANALSIGFFRLAFAAPALGLAAWPAVGRKLWRLPRRDLAIMAAMGGLLALYQVCYFAAIPRLGVALAVIVTICSAPVLVALLAAGLLRERFTVRTGLALLTAVLGTVLLAGLQPAGVTVPGQTGIGLALALGSALGYAGLTLCSRSLAGRYHPLHPITIAFAAGALSLLPWALAGGLVTAFPAAGWLLLLHLGIVPTAFAYWLFLRGLAHTPATVASTLTLAEPLTSTLLAGLVFGETLAPLGWLGAGLLLAGMVSLLRRA